MRHIINFLSLLCISLVLISCSKEINQTNNSLPDPDPQGVTDSIYIDKWYTMDSSGGVESRLSAYSFFYDNQKRVTRVDIITNNGSVTGSISSIDYTYNLNDTLPVKSYFLTNNFYYSPGARDTTTTFYFYDAMGRKSRDSILRTSASINNDNHTKRKIFYTYTYPQGKIICQYSYFGVTYSASAPPDTLAFISADTTIQNGSGNDLFNVFYYFSPQGYFTETAVSYNSEPNVFSRLNIRNNLATPNYFQHFDIFPTTTKNNPVQFHQSEGYVPGPYTTYDWSFSYSYLPNGLVKQTVSENRYQPGSYYKNVFTYSSL